MEHLAETMTDFLLRHKYITEEQAEWCHYIYIECGDCQRAAAARIFSASLIRPVRR